jgi:hypothetical protein
MLKIEQNYRQMIYYLKGLLSDRERHALEKEMMHDAFDEEAFEGLSMLKGEELEADLAALNNRLNSRIEPVKRFNKIFIYRVAAALVLLLGIGTLFIWMFRQPAAPSLITQNLTKKPTASPSDSTVFSYTPKEPFDAMVPEKTVNSSSQQHKDEIRAIITIPSDQYTVTLEDEDVTATINKPEPQSLEYAAPAAPEANEIAELHSNADSGGFYITGRIVGIDHKALAGASIMERGNNRKGTLSDINGNYRILVNDEQTELTVQHKGYTEVDVISSKISGKDITLTEYPMKLENMVVLGYGKSTKAKTSGAGVQKKNTNTAVEESVVPIEPGKPVPPGGSLQAFEKWVEDRINFEPFREYPGDYNIHVRMLIKADGSLSNITIDKQTPYFIAREYKQVIAKSPAWQPVIDENIPIDTEVEITFVLIIR